MTKCTTTLCFIVLSMATLFLGSVHSNRYFPDSAIWFTDIEGDTPDTNSANIAQFINDNGGWGGSDTDEKMLIDFSFHVMQADSSTPRFQIEKREDYYSPDCEDMTEGFPLPPGGRVEGRENYQCEDEDCHILVVERDEKKLYESYISNLEGNRLQTQCALTWDMCVNYPATLRGDQCTSGDAAGFPITQLLFTADEIASGEIDHAIRFILLNSQMRADSYVRPATHAGAPSSNSANSAVYGMRMRLKPSFNITRLKPAARVIARALQKYGMFLSDGGKVALTAMNDHFSTAKYADLGLEADDLSSISPLDFDVMPLGTIIDLTYDCVRNELTRPDPCTFEPGGDGGDGSGSDGSDGSDGDGAASVLSSWLHLPDLF